MRETSGQKGENILHSGLENNDAPNGFGGAIYNAKEGTVDCEGGILSCDTAKCGGAIYNTGVMDCEDDSINTMEGNGGAIYTNKETILGGSIILIAVAVIAIAAAMIIAAKEKKPAEIK